MFIFRHHFGKEVQHLLADRLLTERRGRKLPGDIKHAELEYHQHETGHIELYEDVIKALERKHRAEMEMMVHMLQGKDSSQTRANVKKMTNGKIVTLSSPYSPFSSPYSPFSSPYSSFSSPYSPFSSPYSPFSSPYSPVPSPYSPFHLHTHRFHLHIHSFHLHIHRFHLHIHRFHLHIHHFHLHIYHHDLFIEERENQFVVLKTQRQGWRNRSSDDKRESKSFHLKLLQEAASILYVNQRLETKETGAEKDVAVSLLAKLLHQQEIDAETLLAAKDQVDMQHSMGVGVG
jgi:hypothetical protein